MPQPLQAPPPLAPLPFPPDARTQEMIKEKLQKAEELGKLCNIFVIFIFVHFKVSHWFQNRRWYIRKKEAEKQTQILPKENLPSRVEATSSATLPGILCLCLLVSSIIEFVYLIHYYIKLHIS